MIALLIIVLGAFFMVWLWAMYVAFTQGDDVIVKFGRWIVSRENKR